VTLRNVEPQLLGKSLDASVVRTKKGGSDADIIAWLKKVERYDSYSVERKRAARDVRSCLLSSTTTSTGCRPACCRCWT
jgi:hypothetical protein